MEEPQRAGPWTAAYGIGTAIGFAKLCRMLAEKGVIESGNVEELRHAALQSFDEVRERTDLSRSTLGAMEAARGHLEAIWSRAVDAVKGQG